MNKEDSKSVPDNHIHEEIRVGMSRQALKRAFFDNLFYVQGRFKDVATPSDLYMAAAYTVRDRLLERWIRTAQTYKNAHARTVCYLSAEFLLGPHLGNNMINMGIQDKAIQAAMNMGWRSGASETCRVGGKKAARRYAFARAEALMRRRVAIESTREDPEDRVDALLDLHELLDRRRPEADALAPLREARRLADASGNARLQAQVLVAEARHLWQAEDEKGARKRLDEALTVTAQLAQQFTFGGPTDTAERVPGRGTPFPVTRSSSGREQQ